jgi:hypothetical protein
LQEVQPIEEEAIRLWVAAGAKPANFKGVDVQIVDLPRSRLGLAAADTIWLDKDAAGHGWFIDPTPADSSEFPATPGSAAYGKVDLLTVVAHELGHVLGYEDAGSDGLMAEYLGTGERRVPALVPTDVKATEALHGPASKLSRSLSSLRPSFAAPSANFDHFLALLTLPQEASTTGLLETEGVVPIEASLPSIDQPPLLMTAKANSAMPAARIAFSTQVLDRLFADVEGQWFDDLFQDSLTVPKTVRVK